MVVIDGPAQKKAPPPPNHEQDQEHDQNDQPPAYGTPEGTYRVPVNGENSPLLFPTAGYPNAPQGYSAVRDTGRGVEGGSGGDGGRGREAPWKRFVKAFLVAVVVWMLAMAFVRSLVWSIGGHRGRGAWGDYPIPDGLKVSECLPRDKWETPLRQAQLDVAPPTAPGLARYPAASTTSFELPLSADSLYLLSRGAYSGGSVDVVTSANQKQGSVTVVVTVKYFHEEMRDAVMVCRVERRKGDSGVGIFTPSYMWRGDAVYVETLIVLPEVDRNVSPLHIKNLETDVPNTLHRLHAKTDLITFDKLNIQGSNGLITAVSLGATNARIVTSNAPISGVFNSTGNLSLETSNGAIQVSVKLHNKEASTPNKLSIITSNGPLEANIDLTSSSSPKKGSRDVAQPQYDVETTTSNSRLQTNFWRFPTDAVLRFSGTTSNGLAKAQINAEYQGAFEVQTSNGGATLQHHTQQDPSGRGRKRALKVEREGKTYVQGAVEWVGGRDGGRGKVQMGSVELATSNGEAVLVL
ncbi:hypothetical protein DFP72DRAFT_919955 [Ephemerocybe angulata]|uniref:Uncharacterized protein n=1 Tax=Ephemerocybe angulata TaxID=980116 RepID=A0A8H6LX74_9AGAR|nr:hypothetical protein DFP72DRAFT_919955 [Tulosesus angulatus]